MNINNELTEKVKKFCEKIGIDIVGFADPKLFDQFPKYNQPIHFLEQTKTVIIIGIPLYDIIIDAWFQDSEHSFQFADSILENYCYKVKDFLLKQGHDSKVIPYKPGLYLKDSAALAGIGPIGKNNLLITKEFGPQVRLRALVTSAVLKYGTPILKSTYCENCSKCIDACPIQALDEGRYNREACYPYNITHLRKLSDITAIWCNICIEVCPVANLAQKNEK
jgi:epoxyqueuosine reductase QueG